MTEQRTYLLVDTALIGGAQQFFPRLPDWTAAIYGPQAISVTPLLIDMEGALAGEAMQTVMQIVNAVRPQIHLSILTSDLPIAELSQHFRRFIFVRTQHSANLTLRFADCITLGILERHLTEAQWQALTSPVSAWWTHSPNGLLECLRKTKDGGDAETPLLLTEQQHASIKKAAAPYLIHAHIAAADSDLPGTYDQQCNWIAKAISMVEEKQVSDERVALTLCLETCLTQGELLSHREIATALAIAAPEDARLAIQNIAHQVGGRIPPKTTA